MKEWIPVIQALVWPLFLAFLFVWMREPIRTIIAAIRVRIEQGDTFEATTAGIKIGGGDRSKQLKAEGLDPAKPPELPNTIYLVHESSKRPSRTQLGQEYYRVRIFLDADEPELLNDVEKVVYHMHPTFREPTIVKTNREDAFEFVTSIWGEFNMYAEVHFGNGKAPLLVERYINL